MALLFRATKGSELTIAEMDSNLAYLAGQAGNPITKPFNPVLTFDSHEIFMESTQTADILFSLAATGNQKNSCITVVVNPNTTNALAISGDFIVNGAIDTTQVNVLHFYYANASAVARCTVFNTPYVAGAAPIPTLAAPVLNSVSANSQQTQITASFSQPTGSTTQAVQYGTASDFTGAATVTVTASPAIITGLTASTLYYVRVKASGAGYNDSGYSNVVSATTAAVAAAVAAPTTDPTRFLAYYDSNTAGNTATLWQDTSGHGKNATAVAGQMSIATDPKGANVYQSAAGSSVASWLIPPLSITAQDYTMYLLVNKTSQLNTVYGGFLFDAATGRLVISDDAAVGGLNTGGAWTMTNAIPITALGSRYTMQVWRLKAGTNAATFLTNGAITSTGTYTASALGGAIRLGTDNAATPANNYSFQGRYRLFAVAASNDSDLQVANMKAYCDTLS